MRYDILLARTHWRAYLPSLGILAAVLLANCIALWPETEMVLADHNDYTTHLAIIKRLVTAVDHGENPLDCWSSESILGYPQVRTYMMLPHAAVAGAYLALGRTVSVERLFMAFRWLPMALLPLAFYAAAVLLGWGPWVAAAASLLAPLVGTNALYGIDYASYVAKGWGLFPQAVATWFLLLAIGCADRAFRRRGWVVLAGVLLACACLSQFVYGYIGAVSVLVLALGRRERVTRLIGIALVAAALCAHQIVPIIEDAPFINHSHYEQAYKWNSFGAPKVLQWLVTGELLDFGRLPVLTLLALAGVLLAIWKYARLRRVAPRRAFLVCGAVVWIALYFGRPFWGRTLIFMGILGDFHLHRLIGGVQIFLVLLAATGLAALWRTASRKLHWSTAVAVTAALIYPAVMERARYLAEARRDNAEILAKFDNMRGGLEAVTDLVLERGGRLYPLSISLDAGGQGFWVFLQARELPIVPQEAHSLGLTADMMMLFKGKTLEEYRQYNIKTFVLHGQFLDEVPAFLKPLPSIGSLVVYEAPGTGYFDVVQAPVAVPTTRDSFFSINRRWMGSQWPAKNAHLWLDFGDAPREMARLGSQEELPAPPDSGVGAGKVLSERRNGEVYEANYDAARPAFVIFRMSWHPLWKAYVDGRPEQTMMLSPGVLGVRTPAGRHHILCRYEPGMEKIALLIAGLLVVAAAWIWERSRGRRSLY